MKSSNTEMTVVMSVTFEAMVQEQTEEINRLLAEFEDDQLDMTLQLEAYEREQKILECQQVPELVNLCDDDQQTDLGPSSQPQPETHPESGVQESTQPEPGL